MEPDSFLILNSPLICGGVYALRDDLFENLKLHLIATNYELDQILGFFAGSPWKANPDQGRKYQVNIELYFGQIVIDSKEGISENPGNYQGHLYQIEKGDARKK